MDSPLVGITVDNVDNTLASGKYEIGVGYSRAVAKAGGTPILLPHEPRLAAAFVAMCDGIMLTGGVDPKTESFGEPTHEKARPIDAVRQTFELAILEAIEQQYHDAANPRDIPTLGICLGMQLMTLTRGGKLDQYMPGNCPTAADHAGHQRHAVEIVADGSVLLPDSEPFAKDETIVSHHQQAVADPGELRIVARAPDGIIEAVDDPARRFYLGVQWHPERGGEGDLNEGVITRFVHACRESS